VFVDRGACRVVLTDGTELPADLIVYATGYGSMNGRGNNNPEQDLFTGRHFDQEIIILCMRWYITFKLSFRDLVQMMAERGITLSHTTILR